MTATLTRHDVVVVPRSEPPQPSSEQGQHHNTPLAATTDREMYRLEVNEAGSPVYSRAPHVVDRSSPGTRKLTSVLFPGQQPANGQARRGPAFAVLPTKEDPAAQYGTCYIVNGEHFSAGNPWTWAAWNDGPDGAEQTQASNPWNHHWDKDEFELLIAGPQGQVFQIVKRPGAHPVCTGPLDLSEETEVWTQLREGLVAGSVCMGTDKRVVPLINVTALTP